MTEDRREHVRFPIVRNVGEPVQIEVFMDHKKVSIPGFILNLSAGGMGIITLGTQNYDLSGGIKFVLDLNLPTLVSHKVEGKIIRVEKGRKAQLHHTDGEWFLGLKFTKIKASVAQHINRMAEDWSDCETKIGMKLPDVCFRECSYWALCVKPVKLKG